MAADTPRTFKLTPDGDLDISGGNFTILRGTDAIVQAVIVRLKFFLGEWFLARDAGIPWFQDILIKAPDVQLIQTIFRDAILGVTGILALNSLDLAYDAAARRLTVTFSATTDVGELGLTTVTV